MPHDDRPTTRILSFPRSTRAGDRARHARTMAARRRRLGLRPGLDQLETRQMLSTTPMVGPVSDLQTLDLQLQPGSASALAQVTPLITAAGGGDVQATTISGLYTVQVPSSNMAALARQLAADPAVQYASPAQTLQIQNAPNDPQYTAGIQWALNGAWGINAPAAWNTTTGSYQVIVADIDTGINYNHPDLVDNLWLNQAELPSGLTDANSAGLITFGDLNAPANSRFFPTTDGSGYIDGTDVLNNFSSTSTRDGDTSHPGDYLGWDFFDNTNSPLDQNGHGTVTAGEIGAVGNNGIGVTGVNWNVQLMDLQAFNSAGAGFDIFCAEAIDYAVNHGAKVINASWGFDWVDPTIAQAIQYADQHGVILVAAAGNNGSDDDTNFFAPASYSAQYPNVITVAATDSNGNLASWSNYGVGTVQLAAPGVNIDS
ncbi:MAG TPA: S8 family serine peptidase, partial [Isosphaeraceae bacterium]|nr:S8 family serine peptidase [Isosphaeraceae bacterium]